VGRFAAAVLVVLFALSVSGAQAAQRTDGSNLAPERIARLVTSVPVTTLNTVGAGNIAGPGFFSVFSLHNSLVSHGKPELITMNMAWCPHCAANNWSLAIALSRFGTLTGLRVINTGTYYCKLARGSCTLTPSPCDPYTHGLSFFGARYASPYLSLDAVVIQDVHGRNLQRPTRQVFSAIKRFDPQGGTPAVDVGGRYGFLNSGYDPGALAHKTWSQIASSLANPHSRIARQIDGLANLFTAAICKVTKGRPAAVCTSGGVVAAGAARLH
jgi:uncharacterized protein DUF929